MLELIEIAPDQARMVYQHMQRDFPPSEVMPFFSFKRNCKKHVYQCYWLMEDRQPLGYAVCTPTDRHVLLSFFAIFPDKRNQGLGGHFLSLLKAQWPESTLVLEVDDPAYASKEEEKRLRERRIRFYQREGFHVETSVRLRLFHVNMLLMASREIGGENIQQMMNGFYRPALHYAPLMRFIEVIQIS